MNLCEWLSPWVNSLEGNQEFVIDIKDDTRQLNQGEIFFALPNERFSLENLISSAIVKKPKAIIFPAQSENSEPYFQNEVLLIPIKNLSQIYSDLVEKYFDFPSKKIDLYGVTGTNGKTSCSYFLSQCLEKMKIPSGVIGTLGYGKINQLQFFGMTTPNVLMLQRILFQCSQQHLQALAMEVSSHAIHQNRIAGLHFKAGIFTNLTRDHLDYHGTMENYAAEKQRFIFSDKTQKVIINADDSYGMSWLDALNRLKPTYAYTIRHSVSHQTNIPMIRAVILETDASGTLLHIHSPWGDDKIKIPLMGDFNMSNALAVFSVLCAQGYDWQHVLNTMTQLCSVPGRMETILFPQNKKPWIIVDYAHTPDALEKVLIALRPYTLGKIICIFGCGGNRDPGKRPMMARAAEQYADEIIVTSDNPRYENPEAIISDIISGFSSRTQKKIKTIADREQAIKSAVLNADCRDVILIAGKGAEHYQEIQGEKITYSDAGVVKNIFEN